MRDTLPEQLAVGTTGRFWAVVDGIPKTPEMHGSIQRNDEGFWVAEIEGRLTADGGSDDEQTSQIRWWALPVGARFTSPTAADGKISGKHRNKEDDVRLLVDHMLPRFESWFGDGGQFSARLWWDYNQLKHDPGHAIDYTLVSVFTSAARLLLIGDLLDTVAGTTKPSKRIADHYWQLRDGVQEILQDPERCRVTDARHKRHKRRHRSGASRPAPKGDT